MLNYQVFKDAVEAFRPGGADAHILYSTTAVNDKGFRALLGRKLKGRPLSAAIVICLFVILAVSILSMVLAGQTGTPVFTAYVPVYISFFLNRTTLITFGENGLDIYFADVRRGPKYIVYDMVGLSYDMITNVKTRSGRFNTSITIEFSIEGKKYKIKTTVPNKMKKVTEQAGNLKLLLETLEKKQLKSN